MNLEVIRNEVIRVCKENYEPCKDNENCFIAKGEHPYHVKQNVLSKINVDYLGTNPLNSIAYFLVYKGDTIIDIA